MVSVLYLVSWALEVFLALSVCCCHNEEEEEI